ncbi:Sarcosine oxidase subunit gamma OS=Castellaniella defragrans OX=75697 GN=HNR28_002014 PE=4 SV=1 [Castellaniella defragrans]
MSIETQQETALAGLHARYGTPLQHGSPDNIELIELPLAGLANLRADPSSPAVCAALREALGLALPVVPNTVAQGDGVTALWLAPDEWFLRTEPFTTDLVARVEQALAGQWFAVTAQSSGFAVLRLRGPGVRDVLNGGCPLDLHPRTLPPGTCAQSHFFQGLRTAAAVRAIREMPGN